MKSIANTTAKSRATEACAMVLLLLSATFTGGCWNDAEHLNPLDPLSPEYENAGRIEGQILSRGFTPIGGITVSVVASAGATIGGTSVTQSDGSFSLTGLAPGTFYLTISGDGYTAIVDTIAVTAGQTTPVSHTINALPHVIGHSLRTGHTSRWWPQEDLYRLDVDATVTDPDGLVDIASVTLVIPHLAFERTALPTSEGGVFAVSINQIEMPGTTIHELLGRELALRVADQTGAVIELGGLYLSRVIDDVPETLTPSGSQEVPGESPTLTWLQSDLPFAFTYQVDVYRMDGEVSTVVYSSADIESSVTTHTAATTLITGQYYWTLSVVDGFGNRSRSREAGFLVP